MPGAPSSVLECAPQVEHNNYVQALLTEFAECQVQGWTVWPMRRKRWWALLVPRQWDIKTVTFWSEVAPDQQVRDVMTGFERILHCLDLWPAQ